MNDILIGAADLYGWEQVRPWVKSIRETGFPGDVYLICYRVEADIQRATDYNVDLYRVEHTPYGIPIIHNQNGSPTQAHNYRFYHAWELLTRLRENGVEYNNVIMTDVRDVIFQYCPSLWNGAIFKDYLLAPSEHIHYRNEPWNEANLINGYGKMFYEMFCKDWIAYNVGTIAGEARTMENLFHTIFSMTEGRYYPSDQSSFNVLLRTAFANQMVSVDDNEAWAAQLGTTHDPTKSYLWPHTINRPTILPSGRVVNASGKPYALVHQWDRVPQLKEIITRKYADTNT